jgi:hypothetical protein
LTFIACDKKDIKKPTFLFWVGCWVVILWILKSHSLINTSSTQPYLGVWHAHHHHVGVYKIHYTAFMLNQGDRLPIVKSSVNINLF